MTIDKCCSQRTRTRLVGCPFTLSLNGSVSHKTHWLRCHEYLGVTLSNRIRSTDGTSHKTLSQESATTLYIPGSWHFIVPPAKRHVRLWKPWVAQQTKNELGRNLHKNWFWLDLIHTYYSAEKWLDLVHTHSANCLPFIVHFGGPIAVTSKGLLFCLSHGQVQETLNMTIAQICKTSQHTSRNKLHRRAPVEPQVKASHARE